MYCINGMDPVFDTLLTEKDRYCFNLFYRIREGAGAYIAMDGSTCILAQSNLHTPVWIWLKNSPDEKSCAEISSILRERFSVCDRISVNAYGPYTEALLRSFADSEHAEYRINKRLNVYACSSVRPVQKRGRLLPAAPCHQEEIARLITIMMRDADLQEPDREEARQYTEEKSVSGSLFLWENEEGKIVSMTDITHRTARYARLNAVVTAREHRGHRYAEMLVSSVTQQLLRDGLAPMLYADAGYPPSNAVYRKIGYVKQGEIMEQEIFRKG
ncbi:GNAT family N-acetyltransferase [Eisenbergiella sp.]